MAAFAASRPEVPRGAAALEPRLEVDSGSSRALGLAHAGRPGGASYDNDDLAAALEVLAGTSRLWSMYGSAYVVTTHPPLRVSAQVS